MILELPGLNIQRPWSTLLLKGLKIIETRNYPLPIRFENKWLAIIETPGHTGRRRGLSAVVPGLIKFCASKRYMNRADWLADYASHLVPDSHDDLRMIEGAIKYGWIVSAIMQIEPQPPPFKKGIIYARPFSVNIGSVEI